MKKALALILSLLMGVFALIGCNGNSQKDSITTNPSAADIMSQIETAVTIEQSMRIDDADTICTMYDFDPSMISEMVLLTCGNGINADEIMVVKASGANFTEDIRSALALRQEVLLDSFAGYAPEEEAKIENAQIMTEGNYLLLAICEDPSAAANAFLAAFSETKA